MARLPVHVRLVLALSRRRLPDAACDVTVDYGLRVPGGDGVPLIADHYIPDVASPRPTILVRTPYGRGFPWDHMYGAVIAREGFHVVIQSCRGTGGSGGSLEPFINEAADGLATVAWLRRQSWFNGELATIGASYLGYVQWALTADPPPELRAMVVQVSADDFRRFLYPGGALALEDTLTGVAAMLSFQRGFPRFLLAMARLLRHYKRVVRVLPLAGEYPTAFGKRVGFLDEWLARADEDDPYWAPRRAAVKVELVPPVSLLGGWWDACLDPTLEMYRRLRDAGREVRLTVGPWNHTSGFSGSPSVPHQEAMRWLRAHTGAGGAGLPEQPVRVHVGETGGPGEWRDLPDWPPPDAVIQRWHLHGGGSLVQTPPDVRTQSRFRFDPANPTPAVGGSRMDSRGFGAQRNDKLEARGDVLVFTSEPLGEAVEVIGPVSVRLRASASGPYFDVFARLCDVDGEGHSWNVCDGILRVDNSKEAIGVSGDVRPDAEARLDAKARLDEEARPGAGAGGRSEAGGHRDAGEGDGETGEQHADAGGLAGGVGEGSEISVSMSATAHRFRAGHRLRLQVSGGAHPRFMRNTGTGEPPGTADRLVPVDIQLAHGPGLLSVLLIPVMPAAQRQEPASGTSPNAHSALRGEHARRRIRARD